MYSIFDIAITAPNAVTQVNETMIPEKMLAGTAI
tara:strand:- start:1094 stop:1195 length:102 start_codon:yes stop_codon:yes gene_type:complete